MQTGSPDLRCIACGIQSIILFEKLLSAKQNASRDDRIPDAQNTFKYNFILEKQFYRKQNAYRFARSQMHSAQNTKYIFILEKQFTENRMHPGSPDPRCTVRRIQNIFLF